MTDPITRFTGDYRFLSNFHPAVVSHYGLVYPTSEHAYQAAKTDDHELRIRVQGCRSPGAAKRLGRELTLRDSWSRIRVDIMRDILLDKFSRNLDLRQQLLATGDLHLEEGNTWGDTFWGVCRGRGSNHLGRLLMHVRQELHPG